VATRQERNESRSYDLVRLYLDELEEIEQTMADLGQSLEGQSGRVEVSNGDWKAESVKQLVQQGNIGPFAEFEMKRYGPGYISVAVRSIETRLYVSDANDLQLRGAFEKVDAILRAARRPWVLRFVTSAVGATLVFGGPAIAALLLGLVYSVQYSASTRAWAVPLSVAVLALGVGGYALAYRTSMKRNGLAFLERKSSKPNFFVRNSDSLWLLLIGTTIGVVGSLIASKVAG
jgi:hypothetical protein